MAWESMKAELLIQLKEQIDKRGDKDHLAQLHDLADRFFERFPAEDIKNSTVENLYGLLYGLWYFMQQWDGPKAKVRLFNPEMEAHGWEGRFTVVAVLCRDIAFTTASLRGELTNRGVRVHTINSCNVINARSKEGQLTEAFIGDETIQNASAESLVYFEINPHTQQAERDELQRALEDVLSEVGLVVDDFEPMVSKLGEANKTVADSKQIEDSAREESTDFINWLEEGHMTLLGYEYLTVDYKGHEPKITADESLSLGMLRKRRSSGVRDLAEDLEQLSKDDLLNHQISFSKSRIRSRVHRQVYPDYVDIKVYDKKDRVIAMHRFMGLYTVGVYTMSPSLIPVLRKKVQAVINMSGLDNRSHEGRELVRVLEMFPRDELFQTTISDLYRTCSAVNAIQERRRVRLFVREDTHHKFFNCLVYAPRDRFNTELRVEFEKILRKAFGAQESEFNTHFSESSLVRCHFVLRVDPTIRVKYDIREIEEQIVRATLSWEDRLQQRLMEEYGEERGDGIMRLLGNGFPPGYRDDFDPRVAVLDISKIQRLIDGEPLAMSLHRRREDHDSAMMRLRLYNEDRSLPLSDVLPILENLGLRVVTERPYGLKASNGKTYWIQDFTLIYSLAHDIALDDIKEEFEDAFSRIWFGEAESDSFNRLLIGTRLSWREIAVLRAIARYMRQLRFNFSTEYIAETLTHHLPLTSILVELFLTRFSPAFDGDDAWREEREAKLERELLDSLEQVQNLGEDQIFRRFLAHIKAIVRTNFFQQDEQGELKPYFSFKMRPSDIPDAPRPVPLFEIFVYSPRVEGVHLRGGKVARGGLRWSDRLEDYRTEVLGLVKAQQVKNAVIVPVGAKGGFVAKRLTSDMSREEVQKEGIACYQMFIRGLLDITDNNVEGNIVPPSMVVRKDEDDPYLVVAADKGTATFSDIANELAAKYNFWLGDAFASGGSVGYDHKKMGITARGAWVSVQRHFRELGVDVQNTDFTVVGIGDMSGDVFGNGMLCSEHIRLQSAFNHLHIFVDPNPDSKSSYAERKRLFELPRSSWEDYDAKLISKGGGIFSRAAKSIDISPEMQKCFDIKETALTPNELIACILKAPVDLLWNGGIGTYVKASSEQHGDVGDKANDGLRVDGRDLRAKVVGEGGNLGLTQLGRVEFCLNGGRCNTDFIDNAGGVDCSDHEVNIKILLNGILQRGDLTEKHRNALLEDMTESVSELVLHNNYRQTQALTLIESQVDARGGEYRRFITALESRGALDRQLEFLPSDEELGERKVQGKGLTRPELSVLLSYSKAILKERFAEANFPIGSHLAKVVDSAFPERLRKEYGDEIQQHQLYAEILATQLANGIVNRMGLNYMTRLQKATGTPFEGLAQVYAAVQEIFGIDELWAAIEALDLKVDAAMQTEMLLALVRLVRRASRWLVRNRRSFESPSSLIEEFQSGVATLRAALPEHMRGEDAKQFQAMRARFVEAGVPEDLAANVALVARSYLSLGIIEASKQSGADIMELAALYYHMGEHLELDWFARQITNLPVDNEWQALARDAYLEDLEWQQRSLTIGVHRHVAKEGDLEAGINAWQDSQGYLYQRWHDLLGELHSSPTSDLALFAVANRELLDLAQASLSE